MEIVEVKMDGEYYVGYHCGIEKVRGKNLVKVMTKLTRYIKGQG